MSSTISDAITTKVVEHLKAYKSLVRRNGYTIEFDENTFESSLIDSKTYNISLNCFLKNFPNKNSNTEKKKNRPVDICINADLIFHVESPKKTNLIKYGTRIYYCHSKHTTVTEGSIEYKLQTGLHCDGDVRNILTEDDTVGKYSHPIFHMQLDNSNAKEMSFRNKPVLIQGSSVEGELRNIRIPTSQMDIFSSLMMIFHDHLSGESDRVKFEDDLAEIHSKLWVCTIPDYICTDSNNINDYTALNWYPSAKKIQAGLLSIS